VEAAEHMILHSTGFVGGAESYHDWVYVTQHFLMVAILQDQRPLGMRSTERHSTMYLRRNVVTDLCFFSIT